MAIRKSGDSAKVIEKKIRLFRRKLKTIKAFQIAAGFVVDVSMDSRNIDTDWENQKVLKVAGKDLLKTLRLYGVNLKKFFKLTDTYLKDKDNQWQNSMLTGKILEAAKKIYEKEIKKT